MVITLINWRMFAAGDLAASAAVLFPLLVVFGGSVFLMPFYFEWLRKTDAEVRKVAQSVNALADESDRLRAQEAESERLRTMAREAGLRIRDHLIADDVLHEARRTLEASIDADVVYLRLLEDGRLGPSFGHKPGWFATRCGKRRIHRNSNSCWAPRRTR